MVMAPGHNATLKARTRAVIRAIKWTSLSYGEIGQHFGVTRQAVHSLAHKRGLHRPNARPPANDEAMTEQILGLLREYPFWSYRKIAKQLGVLESRVCNFAGRYGLHRGSPTLRPAQRRAVLRAVRWTRYNYREIADRFGISKQGVQRIASKAGFRGRR